MYILHCTRKLLERIKAPLGTPQPAPTTVLGDWYATALFWRPQVALLVNERTMLPVLMPLAPAATLATRFTTELAIVLRLHGASPVLIAREVAAMGETCIAKTANRMVLGTMNEFAFLAQAYREDLKTLDLRALSMRLADTPCGAIKYDSPARLIAAMGDGGPMLNSGRVPGELPAR